MLLVIVSPSSGTAISAETVFAIVGGLLSLFWNSDGEVTFSIDFAFADPNLYTDDTHFCESFGLAEVDICAEGMERSTTLFEHLFAAHFGAVETAADLNLDAFGLAALSIGEGCLDGTTVSYSTFELTCDAVGNDCSIEVGALNFEDVDLDLLFEDFAELFFDLVNFLAVFADDETRLSSEDGDGYHLHSALDYYAREASFAETGVEVLTDFLVFNDLGTVVVATVPNRVPTTSDTESVANWINFLSHLLISLGYRLVSYLRR